MNRNEALDYLVAELKEWPVDALGLPDIDGWKRIKTHGGSVYYYHYYHSTMITSEDWYTHKNTLQQNYQHDHLDMVNKPPHYTRGEVECIDAIKAATVGKTGIEAVNVGNVIKYLWRYESKNGLEDVKKAQWYLENLIKELRK